MILLATEITDAGVPGREALPLGGIDMTVRRNAFGRQVDSFEGDIDFVGLDAPDARGVHPGAVGGARRPGRRGAGQAAGHPVAVRQGRCWRRRFTPR